MESKARPRRIDIWHNILWSRYKGEVFSALYKICDTNEFDIHFFQIAETKGERVGLSGIDIRYHRYPYELIFKGAIDSISQFKRFSGLLFKTLKTDADLTLLAGYDEIEYWAQLLVLLIRRKKVAVFCDSTIHDRKQKFIRGILKRIFFKLVDGIFSYGVRSREYVVTYGADPRFVFKRCQAAALPFNYSQKQAFEDRVRLAPSPENPRYLYVGRLSSEKALEILLHAFSYVLGTVSKAQLVLVGSGTERERLENEVQTLGISHAVTFSGSKSGDELMQEYLKSTCLVLPSRSEPWGLVVNEALSYGCPVIVSENCGCIPELVLEGKTGFSHVVDNSEDLAQKMLAAPAQFSNIAQTAQDCQELISGYSPTDAANQILKGIRIILSHSSKKT